MSVIGESSLSRALVLHMCCNELPIPDYRSTILRVRLFRPRLSRLLLAASSFFAGRRGRAIVSSSKSSRTREEGPVPGPDISCAHMQITVPRCNHASIWWSTIIRTILLRRLVNRRIARVFAFTQPAYRCCFPKKRSIVQ